MCGIAGIINDHQVDFVKVLDALKHRGPDADGFFQNEKVILLQTRLAIQDIAQGLQPFHHEHFTIVYNGEIYNHLELRAHLPEFHFKTNCDTETLLYLFIKYQFAMFDKIDGMFAFCIYDRRENKIILARDRAGKKPLYYYHSGKHLLFASELNALKKMQRFTTDEEAIGCYLRVGYIWQSHTPYKDVFEIAAGSYASFDLENGVLQENRYFDLLTGYTSTNSHADFNSTLLQLEEKLKRSISDRLLASDVEVGVFLSGGIDSNLIAALAAQMLPKLKTFTVKFNGLYDESHLAKITAAQYGTTHIELGICANLQDDIEKILVAYGEPFMDSSAIPSYYVSREASRHVKVVLSGDGADELFAGYRRYVPCTLPLMNLAQPLSKLLPYLKPPTQKKSFYNYFYRLLAMTNKKGLDFYLSATTDVFEDIYQFKQNRITESFNDFIMGVYANKKLSSLQKMLYIDFTNLLRNDLLVKMDIASMKHSLEVRSPFLSKHLLEFVPSLPDRYKIKRLQTKAILRRLAEKHLAPTLVNQPKRGFEVPLQKWVNNELRTPIHDALSAGCYVENFVEKEFIARLLANKVSVPNEKRAKALWSLYCLEVWHQHETPSSLAKV